MSGVSATERVQIAERAESEIMRFATPDPDTGVRPHALWHKHVHGVELDPMQCLKMQEMDDHPNTVDVSCRRTGKTAVKELGYPVGLCRAPFNSLSPAGLDALRKALQTCRDNGLC